MHYVRFVNYSYQDRPNEQTICFGQDPTGHFIHQIIEDAEMEPVPLNEAVAATNDSTVEFAAENGFDVSFEEPVSISIDGNQFMICRQNMVLQDGRKAVQENAYFFDPSDGVFRMIQFGTLALPEDDYKRNKANYEKYTKRMIRRLIADMCLPDNVIKLPVPGFTIR